jgi:hypothetical protein
VTPSSGALDIVAGLFMFGANELRLPFRIPHSSFRIHKSPSFLNISLMPRSAWRVRASFWLRPPAIAGLTFAALMLAFTEMKLDSSNLRAIHRCETFP